MINSCRHRIIINPSSARGDCGRSIPLIHQRLTDAGIQFDLVETSQARQAVELSAEAARAGYDVVVAVGGDGILNEVLNGLMLARAEGFTQAAIGMLPVGQGNDFAFGMAIPMDLTKACAILANGHRRTIDVGKVTGGDYPNGCWFGNGIGIGFDAMVVFESAKMKRLKGFAAYALAALKTIFLYYKAPLVRLEFAGYSTELRPLMISVMNGQRMGGGFLMAPAGNMTDGLFDLCIARQISQLHILATIPLFFSGSQFSKSFISGGRTAGLRVTALEGTLPVQADGECICLAGRQIDIELVPQAIELLCT